MNGFILCANFDIFVLVLVCPKKDLNVVVGGVNLDSIVMLLRCEVGVDSSRFVVNLGMGV
ncbi:hypothetical protein PHYBLDRAFT_148974 [Phycomyces blakesleeanus NRRL 1555(-)]|uniref:Uncharacterized protein n=1 Tax=Phycomyces blakesleeanus (strain ATCC 8743b / DSM 1359 / FGSC 10004 / NBRC 33097 / NRRL 1555) TaxID=763407 RepID=A0A162PKP3_PHYB8|nr:hypothetical protein PHYBLDRAFT_148974 [Phycomyces blakesleeanus NRRL 1555(-)]OAD69786.1 hypothetical protein PHYBLDRAFT_148974 [Phycomyces blakesleeanus NRRL 1555(-)]|eukprot:XP_018287826.1 hypothetical protein PHYBLDRAFT_148974 [Phycomyces blakesleeanus NRRL 1555(-)]